MVVAKGGKGGRGNVHFKSATNRTPRQFEPGEEAYPEPQVFVFAKPYGWRDDLDGDEALMQVWQAVGVQR